MAMQTDDRAAGVSRIDRDQLLRLYLGSGDRAPVCPWSLSKLGHRPVAGPDAVPHKQPGDVIHLGVSASEESPDGTVDGRGIYTPPTERLRARPEAGLAARLVDSGNLLPTDHIDRIEAGRRAPEL